MSSLVGFLSCLAVANIRQIKINTYTSELVDLKNKLGDLNSRFTNKISEFKDNLRGLDHVTEFGALTGDLKDIDRRLKRFNSDLVDLTNLTGNLSDLTNDLVNVKKSTDDITGKLSELCIQNNGSSTPIEAFYSSDIFDANVLAIIKEHIVECAREVTEVKSKDKYIDKYPPKNRFDVSELWYKNMSVGIADSKRRVWISLYDDKCAYYTATYIYRHYVTFELDMSEMEEYLGVIHVQEISSSHDNRPPSKIEAIRKQLTDRKGTCVVYSGKADTNCNMNGCQ